MRTVSNDSVRFGELVQEDPVTSSDSFANRISLNCSVVNALITDPGEKSMLNKVVVFDIFGPKCIFDASKNSNGPSDVTWTTLKMFLLPFWTWTVYRTYILNGGTESSRTKSKISYTVFRR